MATAKKVLGEKPNDLKRVEIYITNKRYSKLEKEAAKQNRSTKNLIENTVNIKADLL